MEGKTCTKCKQTKPATREFWSPVKNTKDGLLAWCKACNSQGARKVAAERRSGVRPYIIRADKPCSKCQMVYPLTKDYFSAAPSNPDGHHTFCRKCRAEGQRASRKKRLEGLLPYIHRTEKACKPCGKTKAISGFHRTKSTADGYADMCADCCAARARNRRGNQHVRDNLTSDDYDLILQAYDYRCAYCRIDLLSLPAGLTLHFDHRLPVSRGGATTWENMAPACSACNLSKRDLTPEEYDDKLSRLKYPA